MKKIALLTVLSLFLVACGDKAGSLKKAVGQLNGPPSPIAQPGLTMSSTFTPGSYFKVMKEVGSNKDTRVFEFQFLSDKRFILTQTNFQGGDLTKVSFHKKTGTYTESLGSISYQSIYDTCGDLKPQSTYFSGNRQNVVSVNWNGNYQTFYSYYLWTLPSDISSHIVDAIEDVGCKIFQD